MLAAGQESFPGKRLADFQPSPFQSRFKFEDGAGKHDYANGDWEAHAVFFQESKRKGSEEAALEWMKNAFKNEHPKKGMLFCVGNMAKHPHAWQPLGIPRVPDTGQ